MKSKKTKTKQWKGWACQFDNGRMAFSKDREIAEANCRNFEGNLLRVTATLEQVEKRKDRT